MWEILGLEPTTDLKKIKKAYSSLLPKYHPEDDPEGYQRLRQAFDFARKYAKKHMNDEYQSGEESNETSKEINLSENVNEYTEYDGSNEDETTSIDLNIDYLDDDSYKNIDNDESSNDNYKKFNEDYFDDTYTLNNSSKDNQNETTNRRYNNDYLDESYTRKNRSEAEQDIEIDKSYDKNRTNEIMRRITTLYDDYFMRIDVENWKKLFANDILLDFKMIDDINIVLLKFLVKNYLIPQEVWKYLNSIFDWESQYTALVEHFDSNTVEDILNYINEDQFINFNIDWNIENFNYGYYIQLRAEAYTAMRSNNLELAYSNMQKACELYKNDRILIRMFCEYFKRTDKVNKGYHMADILVGLDELAFDGYRYRAYFALKMKAYAGAIKDCDTVLKVEPSEELYVIKAKAYIGLNQLSEAKETLKEALKHYPKDVQMCGLLIELGVLIKNDIHPMKKFIKIAIPLLIIYLLVCWFAYR